MTSLTFTIPGTPQPQQRPRFTRQGSFVRTYDPPKSKAAKKVVSDVATMAAFDAGLTEPMAGPVEVVVEFHMPIPKSSKARPDDYHIKKPDLDNLIKLVLDGISDSCAVWRDDSQVSEVAACKVYGVNPQTRVRITEVDV